MASESRGTVLLAFSANLVIAIAKTAAGVITLSSSMLAEAAHSWADTLNQIFLLTSIRKAAAGRLHPPVRLRQGTLLLDAAGRGRNLRDWGGFLDLRGRQLAVRAPQGARRQRVLPDLRHARRSRWCWRDHRSSGRYGRCEARPRSAGAASSTICDAATTRPSKPSPARTAPRWWASCWPPSASGCTRPPVPPVRRRRLDHHRRGAGLGGLRARPRHQGPADRRGCRSRAAPRHPARRRPAPRGGCGARAPDDAALAGRSAGGDEGRLQPTTWTPPHRSGQHRDRGGAATPVSRRSATSTSTPPPPGRPRASGSSWTSRRSMQRATPMPPTACVGLSRARQASSPARNAPRRPSPHRACRLDDRIARRFGERAYRRERAPLATRWKRATCAAIARSLALSPMAIAWSGRSPRRAMSYSTACPLSMPSGTRW